MSEENIEFLEMNEAGEVTTIRSMPKSLLLNCPHVILVPSHYREDGTCRCNDPDSNEMKEWGYEWDGEKWE